MVYEFDNSDKKNLTDKDIEKIAEMRSNIPAIEKVLQKYGKLVKGGIDMWYTGFSWFLKLSGKPVAVMEVEYSDGRFSISAYRFCSDGVAKNKEKYPLGYPTAKDVIRNNHDLFKYELCRFEDWVTFKNGPHGLADVFGSFIAFIRPSQYACEVESEEE